MTKQEVFLRAIRDISAQLIASIEDYLDISYDKSILAKRRDKIRS